MNLQENIRRILKEELLNESKFFRRRIDIDQVSRLLPVNAEQVYGETESYEQFKYELGWEDLPEQEEIEFVKKVSNVLEGKIKQLYKLYH